MKIVFYPIYHQTPHFETELELMKNHLDAGDTVYTMVCKSDLKTCLFNPSNRLILCFYCHSCIKNGLKRLNNKNLKVISYPKINVDYKVIPSEFQNIDELKRFTLNGVALGLSCASSLISRFNREHNLNTIKYEKEVRTEVKNSYYLSQVFERFVFPEFKPDLVYIFNGRISTTGPVVDVCKNNGISFITHERGGQLGRYWLIADNIPHDVKNAYLEIEKLSGSLDEKELTNIGSKFYWDRRNKVEQGWYSFTKHQKINSLPPSLNKNRKNIVIFNSTIEEFAAVKGWEKPLFLFSDEIKALSSILEHFRGDKNKMFYLRIHPNLKGYDNSQVRNLMDLQTKYSNLEIIPPESLIDSYFLLDNSDVVITFGSTIGIEASFWDKPSIQLGMAFYNNLDSVYIPQTVNQLYDLIESDLPLLSKRGALKYGVWELNRGEPFSYFNQTRLLTGTFMGNRIKPAFIWEIGVLIYAKLGYYARLLKKHSSSHMLYFRICSL